MHANAIDWWGRRWGQEHAKFHNTGTIFSTEGEMHVYIMTDVCIGVSAYALRTGPADGN